MGFEARGLSADLGFNIAIISIIHEWCLLVEVLLLDLRWSFGFGARRILIHICYDGRMVKIVTQQLGNSLLIGKDECKVLEK